MKYPKVTCESCRTEFKFKPRTKTIQHVDVVYVECPGCQERTLSYIADQEIRERLEVAGKMQNHILNKKGLGLIQAMEMSNHRTAYINQTRGMMKERMGIYKDIINAVIHPRTKK